jgi:type IV pilus assembly protein PilO
VDLKDPQTQKGALAVILVLGLGYAFYQYVYTPKAAELAELTAQAERLERYNENAKVAAQANRIAALEEESVSYDRRLEAFEDLIPTTEQVPQLLERVATAALEADVDLLGFTPLPAEPGTFYTEQFFEVEVRGGYHAIGSFLTRIANLPRIIKPMITELVGERVEPRLRGRAVDPNRPPPAPETMVRAKLELSTYVLPGGEVPVVGLGAARAAETPSADAVGGAAPPLTSQGTAAAAPPPSPGLEERFAPGVAPALEAARARAAAQAATPPAAGGAAAPAETAAQAAPSARGPAAADPAPMQAAPPPAAPGDLTAPGGRATRPDDPSRPGALPPLGEENAGETP